jgi:uncharacterized membrane protein
VDSLIRWLLGERFDGAGSSGDWGFGFASELDSYALLAVLAALGLMAFITIRSYRREGDASRRVKGVLAALRLATVLLAVALLLRPAVVLKTFKTLYSSVVVLIDDSLSMSYTDKYDDAQRRQQLAGALDTTDDHLAELSRSQVARQMLARKDGALDRLAADHPLVLIRHATTQPGRHTEPLGSVDVVGTARLAATQPATQPAAHELVARAMGPLNTGGYETNLPAAIREAVDAVQGRRVAGLVVVSDGQNTSAGGNERLSGVLAYASQRRVPVYSLVVGDPTPPRNIAVVSLTGPREARRGAAVEFSVQVAHRNAAGQKVVVKLQRRAANETDWADTGVAESAVLADGSGDAPGEVSKGLQTVTLKIEPDAVGEFVYRAVVEPAAFEQNTRDNYAEAPLTVDDEKINVLLISGDGGWEFQYLRNLLLRDVETYRLSTWQQNADKDVSQLASSPEMKLQQLPRALDQLIGVKADKTKPGYDVVVLYDPQPSAGSFDKVFVDDLLRAFVERGGGVCYIAGNKYTEGIGSRNEAMAALAELLPVMLGGSAVDIRERIGEAPQPWQATVTSYGRDHAIMRLAGTLDDSEGAWKSLPGIYWSHPVSKLKPAAYVLAENTNPVRRTAKNEAEPLVATMAYGKGRVVYLGTDETWRWRAYRDGACHRRFWGNMMRYLATARSRQVIITAGGERFSAGENIAIEVEAYDEKYQPLSGGTFELKMVNTRTNDSQTLTAAGVEGKRGRFKLSYKAAAVGSYEIQPADEALVPLTSTKRIEIELPQAEALRTEANEEVMRNIASRPENFLRIADAGNLANLVPVDRLVTVDERRLELWDTKAMLLAMVLLLGVEWIIRKKHNMA